MTQPTDTQPTDPSTDPPPGEPAPGGYVQYASVGVGDDRPQGFAITALVLGIVSIVACLCYGLPGAVVGSVAIVFATLSLRNPNAGGDGLAKAGLITGIIGTSLGALYFIVMVGLFVFAFTATPGPPMPIPPPTAPAPPPVTDDDGQAEGEFDGL